MLVSTITRYAIQHLVLASTVENVNTFGATSVVSPTLDKIVQPTGVINPQFFGAATIQKQPAKVLTATAVANVNTIPNKTIQIDAGGEVYQTPSYANLGGTGDRTGFITVSTNATLGGSSGPVSTLVNGLKANGASNACWWNSGQSNRHATFAWSNRVLITEAKWFQNGDGQHGTWKWQGSDDGVGFTDLSATFTLNGAALGLVIGNLAANTTGYKFYRLQQTGGVTTDIPWLWECDFKIGNPI